MKRIFHTLLILTLVSTASAQMSGSYTIGSTSSNFSSIQQAVDSLVSQGINGSVILNLTKSNYSEQIKIPEISGTSSSNTITIKPNGSTSVSWGINTATVNANYVLKLDSADFIIIQGITFTNSSLNYGRLIEIEGEACNNRFIKNTFVGQNVNSSSDNYTLVYSAAVRDTANIFDSNSFTSGSTAISLSGSGNPENFNQITNNSFINQYINSIYCSNQEKLLIEGNLVKSNSGASIFTGIEVESSYDFIKIIRNKITFYAEGFCLLVNNITANPGNDALIANNMIHAGGNTAAIGIFVETSNYLKIYNNNINITSTTIGSAGRAINIQDVNGRTSHIAMRNNVIVNRGLGFGIITFTTDTISSDYNCFYTPNCPFGYWNGYGSNTMAIWWLYTNQDSHSVITNPGFFSPTDLHVSHKNLDSAGFAFPEIITDFDGQSRNAQFPDIGADEFSIITLDAGLTQFIDPKAPCPDDSSMISIRIKNFGLDTIHSMELNWYANGILQNSAPIVKQMSLAAGQLLTVSLANFYFVSGKANDIKVEIVRSNLTIDANSSNNQIIKTFYTALTGNYSIGMGQDFENITNAIGALHEFGVCGNVTFNIKPGFYADQLSINEINGVSALSEVRFIGQKTANDSVIISYTAAQWYANYALKIGSPWVSFENLSLINDGASYGRVVDLVGGTHGVRLINNNIIGVTSTNSSAEFAVVYAADNFSSDSSMVFDSNSIMNGSYGIWLAGLSLNDLSSNNIISNNRFRNQYIVGIQSIFQKSFQATANNIETNTTYSNYAAIQMQSALGDYIISSNKINVKKGRYGINITSSNGNPNSIGLISNNFIHVGGNFSNVKGIGLDMSSYTNIYNNSIHITTDHYSSSGLYINSNVTNTWIYNNNLVNTGLGYATSYFGTTNLKSNYNNFYTTSNNFAWFNGNKTNLAAWQLATSFDPNSVSANPYFTSKVDLHAKASELDSAGTTLQKVLYDIDGELRNPYFIDIGADEFQLLTNDAGIASCPSFKETSCDGIKQLEVELINYGVEKLDSIYIALAINGQITDTITYNGPLMYLKSDTVDLGYYTFSADSNYTLTFFTFLPNGKTDEKTDNDSLIISQLNIIPTPKNISTQDTFICYNDSALLHASATNAHNYFWFDSIAGGKLQHMGKDFKTPKLKSTKTYYVEARSKARPDSLKTTYTTGLTNLGNGCMFDISAVSSDITIDSFDIHTQYKSYYPVWVYYKKGSYVGFQNDSSSWILVDTVTVQGLGFGKASRVPIGGFTVPKGELFAIYISTIPVSFLNFSTGSNFYMDDNLAIWPGLAVDYLFDATFATASVFNGQIYYSSGSYCSTARVGATATVKTRPDVSLPNDTSLCFQKTVDLSGNHGPNYNYEWRLLPSATVISTNEFITLSSNGNYTLTVNDGCGNADVDTIKIVNAFNPVADFIINDTSQCIYNNRFKFSNKSYVLQDTMFFEWNFGNGDGSVSINPQYSYKTDNVFRVTLRAVSGKGCVDSISRNAYVNPGPMADFSANTEIQCLNNNSFDFYNRSTINSGSMTFNWNLGDGNNSTTDSIVNHKYSSAKTFDIELIAKSNFACYDTILKSVIVKSNPIIDLGKDTTICAEQHIILSPGFSFDKYLWSNDSTMAAILVDSHGIGIGSKTIWVKVTEEGCESYDTIHINFVICGSVGENDFADIIVYPNPVSDKLHIETRHASLAYPFEISLLNVEGKQLFSNRILSKSLNGLYSVDVSQLPTGIYLLRIKGDYYSGYSKFIKK